MKQQFAKIWKLSLFLSLFVAQPALAQDLYQTVRGQVVDQLTKSPLPGVNVIILGTDPLIGTATDLDGYFKIENVPVGRISLQATFLGYNPISLNNLNLTTGKELLVNIALEEKVITTKTAVVTASSSRNKLQAQNEMATISARTFSVEESQRFAGARNDVSRMAANFAGVRGTNDAVNDIVIRGNSPNGLLWRFEGVDIPNPNHFGSFGSTGGPVSMLNNNVLSNSDFLTGAFPSEYGNALSGVFDLKMRNGNNEKHEFLGQVGFNGFEFGAEGPISKEKRSSYLVNARYSTLGFMEAVGIEFGTGSAVPQYQDVSFKLNFPGKKLGSFSVFGLAGSSQIDLIASGSQDSEDENLYSGSEIDVYVRSQSGVVGVSNTYLINNTAYSKLTIGATAIQNQDIVDSVSTVDRTPQDFYRQNILNAKFFAAWVLNKKVSSKNNLRAGAYVNQLQVVLEDSIFRSSLGEFQTITDFSGSTLQVQPYVQWQYRPSNSVTFNTGVHMEYLALNDNISIEPRAGVRWAWNSSHSLSAGYGLHSQMTQLYDYYRQVRLADGSYATPNKNLEFTKSHHFVLGYDWQFSETMRFKAETYYQSIFDAVVEVQPSSYSFLNTGSFSNPAPDSLVNGGTGENYGVEITLEKFLDRGFYFLATGSLYESNYKGSDDIERKTAFSGTYVFNLLGGKEFYLKSKKEAVKFQKLISVDLRFTGAGGQRYTPVDVEASRLSGESEYLDDLAFSEKFADYFRGDVRIAYRMDGSKFSQEWALDVQNVSNRKNPYFQRFDPSNGEVQTVTQLGIFPILQYRIEF